MPCGSGHCYKLWVFLGGANAIFFFLNRTHVKGVWMCSLSDDELEAGRRCEGVYVCIFIPYLIPS